MIVVSHISNYQTHKNLGRVRATRMNAVVVREERAESKKAVYRKLRTLQTGTRPLKIEARHIWLTLRTTKNIQTY